MPVDTGFHLGYSSGLSAEAIAPFGGGMTMSNHVALGRRLASYYDGYLPATRCHTTLIATRLFIQDYELSRSSMLSFLRFLSDTYRP